MMEIPHVMLDKREAFFLHYPHATSDDWINLGAHQRLYTRHYHTQKRVLITFYLVKTSQYTNLPYCPRCLTNPSLEEENYL